MSPFCGPVLLALALAPAPTSMTPVDLTTIERVIENEPGYQGKPKYCMLVFGSEAKVRKWLVIDGNALYVDHKKHLTPGDPAATFKRWRNIDLGMVPDAFGTQKKAKLTLIQNTRGILMELELDDKCRQLVGYDHADRLAFAELPKDAPMIHFGGPLEFRWYENKPTLVAGQNCDFFTKLGSPGLGKGAFAAVEVCSVPRDVKLSAEIEFPIKVPELKPVLEKYKLGDD